MYDFSCIEIASSIGCFTLLNLAFFTFVNLTATNAHQIYMPSHYIRPMAATLIDVIHTPEQATLLPTFSDENPNIRYHVSKSSRYLIQWSGRFAAMLLQLLQVAFKRWR